MDRFCFSTILIFLIVAPFAFSENSYYTVIAPGTLKSNRQYTVCVALHDAPEPADIRISLVGEPLLNLIQNVELQPFESKLIDFMLPKLNDLLEYKLLVEAVKGATFRNVTTLGVFEFDSLKIYIQMDKGVYKPGDVMQFRVLVLDGHLKPFKSVEPIKVLIFDSNRNRVKQHKDVQLNSGVFTGKFKISEQSVVGTWKIVASVSGKYETSAVKMFQVEKYILPKFSVHLETDSHLVVGEPTLTFKVFGKYTYGKYVEGTAKIAIICPYSNETMLEDSGPLANYRATFQFRADQLNGLQNIPFVGVLVKVTELQTGLTQSTMQHVTIHKEKYDIIVPETDIEFHNSKPYKIRAIVQHWNGSRVQDRDTPFLMKHGNGTYRSYLDDQGVTTFTFDYSPKSSSFLYFDGASKLIPNIFISDNLRFDEPETRCVLKWKEGRLKFGTGIEIELTSKFYIPYIVYTITSHSSIVRMRLIQLPMNQKSHIIKVYPAIDMIPTAYVYVHYIENGNLRYCELKLRFPHEFENQVSIGAPTSAKPGENVTLTVNAETQSFVGLLALDLRAHLLNSDYNLNKANIFTELMLDRSFSMTEMLYPGEQSGLLTLTNAHFIYDTPRDTAHRIRDLNDMNEVDPADTRSNFPETWIFTDLNVDKAQTQLSLKVPDSITTWLITAFSINDKTGFGMMDYPVNITVFKPFFISTNLPYSIKRGEILQIPVTIFNYHSEELLTTITMSNTKMEYEFVEQTNDSQERVIIKRRQINVPANSGKSVDIAIRPTKLGSIDIELNATSKRYSDAIIEQLKVEPEGLVQLFVENTFVNLSSNQQKFTTTFEATIPLKTVPDSEFIQLSIGGDALSAALDNLEALVLLPTGCGEQNMINFAPNVLVLNYLKAIGKTAENSKLVDQALRFIDTGYQQELIYRHESGAFSVFGPIANSEESTWLTAYVMRFFIKALPYGSVEPRLIESGLEYLAGKQVGDGSFPNTGHLFYSAHQNRYGFTAFVLMAFLENSKYAKKYQNVVHKGINFLTKDLDQIDDTYALSLMAVALQMSKSDRTSTVINTLLPKAKLDNGLRWWTSSDSDHTNDVEITAYVLMTLLDHSSSTAGDHIAIYKWLLQQRSQVGGFKSTHDTVVGLQALIKYSQKYGNLNSDTLLKVDYTAKDNQGQDLKKGVFGVDPTNLLILQQVELPQSTRSVAVEIVGHGSSVLQFSYHFYLLCNKPHSDYTLNLNAMDTATKDTRRREPQSLLTQESFKITPIAKMSTPHVMEMEICFVFKPTDSLRHSKTNMVIMEVNLPSGFTINSHVIKELQEEDSVARVETKNADSTIMIYFEHLNADADEKCLGLMADKNHDIGKIQPSRIEMYDYYYVNHRDTVMYELKM